MPRWWRTPRRWRCAPSSPGVRREVHALPGEGRGPAPRPQLGLLPAVLSPLLPATGRARDRARPHVRARRPPCSACGTMKRHSFDAAALEGGFDVLVTGHNLDDEAARLMGNVLRWQTDHLARQRPVLPATHPKFVRKVKPLYLTSEYETAVYAFMRGLDYIVDECPNAAGASQLLYKDVLNR